MTLIALHGFLGAPGDWDLWSEKDFKVDRFLAWNDTHSHPCLKSWAVDFNQTIAKTTAVPRILMGYSLGGRKVLHALLDRPELWQGAILISTHPGLQTEEERNLRLRSDLKWAERFQSEPWKDLMQAWEAQPVFENASYRPARAESYRSESVHAMEAYSLGKQADLKVELSKLAIPLHWITGEKDAKFTKIAAEMLGHSHSSHHIISKAGHRVPWESPYFFAESIKTALHDILFK